jgi:transposase
MLFFNTFERNTKYNHINNERYNGGMKRIQVPPLSEKQQTELEELYRKTDKPRYRTRAQMILLSAEKRLKGEEIAEIVRTSHITVLRWLKRYKAEGIEGLKDEPREGSPAKVTEAYHKQLIEAVRRRPRSLGLPYSMWTLRRLADYMAEETGLRVSYETVRRASKGELDAAEAAEIEASQAGAFTPEVSEEDQLRKQLDDSRYENP